MEVDPLEIVQGQLPEIVNLDSNSETVSNVRSEDNHNTAGQKILKSPGKKNSWNQINQFDEQFFWPNSIFCNFKNDQKSILELGKSLKLSKMQFHE